LPVASSLNPVIVKTPQGVGNSALATRETLLMDFLSASYRFSPIVTIVAHAGNCN